MINKIKNRDKVLVTGGVGFIGSHLVDLLLKKGYEVNILVRDKEEIHWRYNDFQIDNRIDEFKERGAKIFYGNLLKKDSLIKALMGVKVIYHLGAVAYPYFGLPKKVYMDINLNGTKNLLEVVLENQIKLDRFVYISSIEAAGPSRNEKPLTEDSQTSPLDYYGESKLATEKMLNDYMLKIPITIVRPTMQFGEGDQLLLKIIKYMKSGFFPIFGSGNALFEMCYVGNTVEGIYLAGIKKEAIGNTYFISDGSKELIKTIEKISKLSKNKIKIIHIPKFFAYFMAIIAEILNYILPFPPFRNKKTGAPLFSRKTVEWTSKSEYFCSTNKAKQDLGFIPSFTFEEGVKRTINWYKKESFL